MLEVKKLKAGYVANNPIINDLSFKVEKGENILIVGQNGSGKSTLAKAIMGVLPFCEGNILLQNKEINNLSTNQRQKRGISWLMQANTVFPNLSVMENISLAASGLGKKVEGERLKKYSKLLTGINKNKKAAFLSGGEKRLLSLVLVLISSSENKFIILDEPSAGVSQRGIKKFINSFQFLIDSNDSSFLLIEHNEEFISLFNYQLKINL